KLLHHAIIFHRIFILSGFPHQVTAVFKSARIFGIEPYRFAIVLQRFLRVLQHIPRLAAVVKQFRVREMQRGGLVVIFYSAVVVVRHKLHITAMEPGYGQLTVALDSTAEILKGAWIIFLKVPAVSAHVVGFGVTLTA